MPIANNQPTPEQDIDDAIEKLLHPSTEGSLPGTTVTSSMPGVPDQKKRKFAQNQLLLVILILLILAALIGMLVGPIRRGEFSDFFRRATEPSFPEFELIEARNGYALIIERQGNLTQINVKVANENGWRNVSMDDLTIKNPALSLTGTQLAYISEKEGPHIVVVSLTSNARESLKNFGRDPSLSIQDLPTTVCPWSTVQWSPNGKYLAFFVCKDKASPSFAVAANWDNKPPMIIWSESKAIESDKRNILWLDDTTLIISTHEPVTGTTIITSENILQSP